MALRSGNESFLNGGQSIGLTLLDFWRFQFSNIFDLQEHIAEFLVAKALELDEPHNRDGWTLWDIVYRGIRIEVKETGYYYSWQKNDHKHDTPRSWDIHETFVKDEKSNPTGQKERQNDIYVFCLNTGETPEDSDPLELTHWEFYVVETAILNQKCKDQKSISLSRVQDLTNKVPYTDLKKAIDALIVEL